MISVTDTFKENFASGKYTKYLTLTFLDESKITLTDIVSESLSIEESICEDETMSFGGCISASFKLNVFNKGITYKNKTFFAKLTINNEDMPLGTYKVFSDELSDNKLTRAITAYDFLYELSQTDIVTWYNKLNAWPIKLKDIRDSLFTYLGIEQEDITLPCDDMYFYQSLDTSQGGVTATSFISAICALNGCFGYVDKATNKFKYRFLDKTSVISLSEIQTASGTLKYSDFSVPRINKLTINSGTENLIVSAEDKSIEHGVEYVIDSNSLIDYNFTDDTLLTLGNAVLSKISDITYTPCSLQVINAPWLELGDYYTYTTPEGKIFYSYVLHQTFSGIQALKHTIEAKGTEQYVDTKTAGEAALLHKTKAEQAKNLVTLVNQSVQKTSIPENSKTNISSILFVTGRGVQAAVWMEYNLNITKKVKESVSTSESNSPTDSSTTSESSSETTNNPSTSDVQENIVKAKFSYTLNGVDLDYSPETLFGFNGKQLVNPNMVFLTLDPDTRYTFNTYLTLTNGSAELEKGDGRVFVMVIGGVGEGSWDGTIKLEEMLSPITLSNITVATISDSAKIAFFNPVKIDKTEAVTPVSLPSISVADMSDTMEKGEIIAMVVTNLWVDKSTDSDMTYNRDLVIIDSEGKFVLKTTYGVEGTTDIAEGDNAYIDSVDLYMDGITTESVTV